MKSRMWLLVFVLCALVTRSHAQKSNIAENFDMELVGATPSNWKTGGGGSAVVTNSVFHSKPNSFALVNNKVGDPVYALKTIEPAIASNESEGVAVAFRIRLAQTNAAVNVMTTDAATAFLFRICFNNGGQITASSGKEDLLLASYQENVWYDVRIVFVPARHEYEVMIRSGQEVVANRKGLSVEPREFYYLYLQNFGMTDGKAAAYFDDVAIVTRVSPTR